MFLDVFYNIFWLFTTSDLFVKDAEPDDEDSKTDDKEKTSVATIVAEDCNVAGILGNRRKYLILEMLTNIINVVFKSKKMATLRPLHLKLELKTL